MRKANSERNGCITHTKQTRPQIIGLIFEFSGTNAITTPALFKGRVLRKVVKK